MTPAQLSLLATAYKKHNDPDPAKDDNKPKGIRAFQQLAQ